MRTDKRPQQNSQGKHIAGWLQDMRLRSKPYNDHERRKRAGAGFLAPSLVGVCIFYVMPFIIVIWYSVVDSPIQGDFVGLDNFISVLNNSAFLQAARNTAVFSAVAVPLSVGLSLLMAVLLEMKIPYRNTLRTLFLTPLMVPTASVVLIWQVFFSYNGAMNDFLMRLGAGRVDWFESSYSQVVVIILFLWKNLGYDMVLFLAALSDIPQDYIEVADLDGATAWQKFRYIKLRYLSPAIFFVTVLSLINSFRVFREVYLLTGDYPYDTLYMLQHFMNNTFHSMDYQKLSSAAVLMFLVMFVIIGILFKAEERYGKDVEG